MNAEQVQKTKSCQECQMKTPEDKLRLTDFKAADKLEDKVDNKMKAMPDDSINDSVKAPIVPKQDNVESREKRYFGYPMFGYGGYRGGWRRHWRRRHWRRRHHRRHGPTIIINNFGKK
ncbi:hypothetical protein M3Y97_01080900 [Aphelenchoides bicaudatus]|nr:hypothetical protein M3Y97_01080900 [Aphelenchoides bicaudatus]